jgi:hypothetical protein
VAISKRRSGVNANARALPPFRPIAERYSDNTRRGCLEDRALEDTKFSTMGKYYTFTAKVICTKNTENLINNQQV